MEPTKDQAFKVCQCLHCAGHLEFSAEHAGTIIECPHCGKNTVLKIPITAKAVEVQHQQKDGKEGVLEFVWAGEGQPVSAAENLDLVGMLVCILCFLAGGIA